MPTACRNGGHIKAARRPPKFSKSEGASEVRIHAGKLLKFSVERPDPSPIVLRRALSPVVVPVEVSSLDRRGSARGRGEGGTARAPAARRRRRGPRWLDDRRRGQGCGCGSTRGSLGGCAQPPQGSLGAPQPRRRACCGRWRGRGGEGGGGAGGPPA